MGTAAVLVQQLFGGLLALVCAGGVVGNGAGGQVIGIGGNFITIVKASATTANACTYSSIVYASTLYTYLGTS